ncbi:hypothetical protein CDD80_7133 [Ophiocordyceps camponoti-rufipedis]|uniref:Retrovirus-related Pol polyprotein from transposon TNT 1-94-like beta-barrel domain-containing protein n=1 Tax=Ophiocordyceps camponoti-rufipedis TaxID=2004952 RepID=A0A2C5ZEN7_9HYPO|nr:hypothetical protein CDD80_7133 [Ophiocordyceps camponoti-rufipedis]
MAQQKIDNVIDLCDVDETIVEGASEGSLSTTHESEPKDRVYLCDDSRFHMFNDLEWFTDFERFTDGIKRVIPTADGKEIPIYGEGTVRLCFQQNDQIELRTAYYAPSIAANVVSQGQLTGRGYRTKAKGDGDLVLSVFAGWNQYHDYELEWDSSRQWFMVDAQPYEYM